MDRIWWRKSEVANKNVGGKAFTLQRGVDQRPEIVVLGPYTERRTSLNVVGNGRIKGRSGARGEVLGSLLDKPPKCRLTIIELYDFLAMLLSIERLECFILQKT